MPELPFKMRRKALQALSRDTLATITSSLNLAVGDRLAHAAQALKRVRQPAQSCAHNRLTVVAVVTGKLLPALDHVVRAPSR